MDLDRSPHIAILLMITSEHLDYHKDIMEYVNAKRNIINFQNASDFAIINRDYPASNESDIYTEGKIYRVSRERETPDDACYVKDGAVWFRKNGNLEEIIDIKDIKLPGMHNLENICASIVAAKIAGVSKKNIITVLKTFKGLEHRLEFVDEIKGVKYYDDSFSTTPETAIAAIEAFPNPEILILGGSSKKSDFSELGEIISKKENIKAIIGIGIEWPNIKLYISNLENYSPREFYEEELPSRIQIIKVIEGCKNMEEVVKKAAEIAKMGDVVILSPACASFDMFKNYKDRGNQFKEAVKRLRN